MEDLEEEILAAAADGLNKAAAIALEDIRQNAPYRSGRLSKSYSIVRYATPENLDVVIDSNVPYRFGFYPLVPRFGVRNRPNVNPALFVSENPIETVTTLEIEKSIDSAFNKEK